MSTLSAPPRGSPPATTSSPGLAMLHRFACNVPSGARLSNSPTLLFVRSGRSQSVPDGAMTTRSRGTSPLTRCSTSTRSRRGRLRRRPPPARRSGRRPPTIRAARAAPRWARSRTRRQAYAGPPRASAATQAMSRERIRPRPEARRPGRRRSRSRRRRARLPLRRSSWIIVPRMRPPEAPIGCPSATAPPLTFANLLVHSEHSRRVLRDGSERLVNLHALDVVERPARRGERVLGGSRGRARDMSVVVRDVSLAEDRSQRLEPAPCRERLGTDDDARGAVVHARRVARGGRPVRVEDRLERSELFERPCRAGCLRPRSRPRRGQSRRRNGLRPGPRPRASATGRPTRPAPLA